MISLFTFYDSQPKLTSPMVIKGCSMILLISNQQIPLAEECARLNYILSEIEKDSQISLIIFYVSNCVSKKEIASAKKDYIEKTRIEEHVQQRKIKKVRIKVLPSLSKKVIYKQVKQALSLCELGVDAIPIELSQLISDDSCYSSIINNHVGFAQCTNQIQALCDSLITQLSDGNFNRKRIHLKNKGFSYIITSNTTRCQETAIQIISKASELLFQIQHINSSISPYAIFNLYYSFLVEGIPNIDSEKEADLKLAVSRIISDSIRAWCEGIRVTR